MQLNSWKVVKNTFLHCFWVAADHMNFIGGVDFVLQKARQLIMSE